MMAKQFYVLNDKRQRIPATEEDWKAFPKNKRLVAKTELRSADVSVWTEFHGVDYGEGEGPQLFATFSFVGNEAGQDGNYTTWAEAEAGHRAVVADYQRRFPQS